MNAEPRTPEQPLSRDDSPESEAGGFAPFSVPRQITGVVIAGVVAVSFCLLLGTPLVLIALLVLAGVFAFLDAWHAGIRKKKGAGAFLNISPMGWGIAFMGLLIVSYPAYLFSRNRLKTKPGCTAFWALTNVSALLTLAWSVVLLFLGLRGLLGSPDLPSCTSREVVRLVEQVVRSTPAGATTTSISGHREISYDREANRRQGQCVVHTDGGDLVVNYIVQWRDREKGQFEVHTAPAELPNCTSREVVQVLEQAIRGTPAGAKARSIDGHREVGFDQATDRRKGECVVHTDGGDLVVKYMVQWRDREKGLFEVQIPPPEPPNCTSREVVQVLEQAIRGTPAGAKVRSIDGHREVSFDQATDRRKGQCVVHTDGRDLVVNYVVQWRDREKGQFEVAITP